MVDLSAGALVGAAGDLFGGLFSAAGNASEATAYGTAATLAKQNAQIAQESGNIKEEQTQRQIYKTLGAQQAQYGAAGLTGGGSAQEVLRSSVSQGSLEKAIVNEQTQINVTGYEAQAAQFKGMQGAAKAASGGGLLGGILGAALSFL
jgi:hypothetical protein